MIGKLEKEIAYLSTLLTYWKPLEEHPSIPTKDQLPISHLE